MNKKQWAEVKEEGRKKMRKKGAVDLQRPKVGVVR